ncbi:MAG: PAS domain S-box protein, partial [Syntrophales bacterium]|nr:PAS domain S-box protein [Syntrophales bacterium]
MTTRKKGKKESHQESEDRFRLLFNCVADALFLHDLAGRFVEVNQAACDSLGYTQEELLQLSVTDVEVELDCGLVGDLWERISEGDKLTVQGLHRRKDGTTFPVEVHFSPFEYAGRPHILASVRDITQRLWSEEALRTSESFLRSIVDWSPYPMWISDDQGTLIKLNQACQDLLHLSAGEVEGKYNVFQDNIVAEQGLLPLLHRVFEQGETVRFEIIYDTSLLQSIPIETPASVILDVTVSPILDGRGQVTSAVFQHVDITQRKRAEAALAESEQRFSTFMDFLPGGIFMKDQTGRLLFANRYLKELFGWEDCLGKTTEELLPPEFAARMVEDDRRALSEGSLVIQERIVDRHGEEHFFDTYKFPIGDAGTPTLLGGVAVEVTERKRAEEALRREKLFTEAIVDSLPGTFFIMDGRGMTLRTNAAGPAVTGYSPEELSKMHALDFIADEDKPAVQQALAEVFAKSETSVEARLLTKDGRKIPFLFTAHQFIIDSKPCLLGTGVDITALKQAEEAVRESEERYRTIFQNHHTVMLLVDPETGSIMDANPAACAFYGFSKEELLAQKTTDLNTLPADQVFQAMQRAKMEKRKHFQFQHRLASGEVRDVELFSGPIRIKGKDLLYSIVHDVTARKKAEEALRESERILKEAQEMAHLGFWHWNVKTGEVTWSEEVYKIFQLDLKEFTPHIDSILELSPWPGERERDQELIRKAMESHEKGAYEQRFLRPDKSIGYYYSTFQGKYDEEGNLIFIVGTVLDITERKLAEEALRQSEARFRQVVESSPLPIGLSTTSGKIEYLNPKFVETFGYTLEDIPQLADWFRLAYPDPAYRESIISLWQESVAKITFQEGIPEEVEVEIACKDGSKKIMQVFGSLIGDNVLTFFNDLTERKRMEERLREKEKKYRSLYLEFQGILNTIPDILCLISPDLRIVWGNEANAQAIPGAQLSDILGEHCYPLRHDRSEPCENCPVVRCFSSGKIETAEVISFGEPWELRAVPLYDDQGKLRGAIELARNIKERKQAEAQLLATQERLELALQGADLGTWDWDLKTGVINCNKRWAEMLGYTLEEIEPHARFWEKLIHPDDVPGVMKNLNAHLEGLTPFYETEHRLRHKSGEWVWVLDKGKVIERDAQGKAMRACGTHLDITERKRVEEVLKISEVTYREIFNTVSETIWIYDIDTRELIDVNNNVKEMFGYSVREAMDLTVEDISSGVPPFIQEAAVEFLKKAAAGEPQVFEWHCKHKDGHLFWSEVHLKRGTIAGRDCILALERDITERKLAEKALRESETRFRQVVEHSPMPIAIVKEDQGEYLNPKFVETLGYTLEDLPRLADWFRLAYPDPDYRESILEKWRKAREEAIAGDQTIRSLEVQVTCKDGSVRTMEIWGIMVGDKTIFFCTDLTERKLAEEERARMEARMREVQKLESLGVLAGGIAHDFNNLLMAILGNADLALLSLSPASPARPNVEEITRAPQRAADL